MIINIRNKERFKAVILIMNFLSRIYHDFFFRKLVNKLNYDSSQLNRYFRHKYPSLKKDPEGNILCVSCDLCQEVCPSGSIKLSKANMMNFTSSLKTWAAPLHFYLNVETCVKCNLCAEVCSVDAIELTSSYTSKKIDLVIPKEAEKSLPGLES